jgi:hypothetical protein
MKLNEWLMKERRTAKWLAQEIGNCSQTIYLWRCGKRAPPLGMQRLIKSITGGEVTEADWPLTTPKTKDERQMELKIEVKEK